MTKDELLKAIKEAAESGQYALNLSDSQLMELPPEIQQLTSLKTLYLQSNELTKLPPEIGHLTGLTTLKLSANELTELPPEIGQLTGLTDLDLGINLLTELPPEIGQLTSLESLYLDDNQLKELPPEIGQLANLTTLDLDENQLTELPPEIGQLTNLYSLALQDNQLTKLPPEIWQLTNLTSLHLNNNPLPIPPEILEKRNDPAAIINYYFQHQTGRKKPLNEAKMLVVGQGSVGKTSLVRLLTEGKFDPRENKTEGIDIRQWQIKVNDQNVRLNVWDFGGQEIMHATHQFFLTKRSLYVLVMDARLGEEENRLEYWLKIIQSFGKDSPVIIVGNKVDQQGFDLDRRGLQAKYSNIKAFVETSCPTAKGIDELKTVITQEVGALEHIHDQLLANWFAVKEHLEGMKEDYIPIQEYVRLCQAENIKDEISQNTLIGFLHDLGLVLNFRDDPRLEETNILNPEWVTNGVYKILNSHMLFQSKGMLERQWLGEILDKRKYPKDKHLFIMNMMRKFELCFDFVDFPDKRFLIPDLLTKEEPDTGDWSGALAFQYHYSVLPTSIISRFIVRMQESINQNTLWRTGVVLKNGEGNRALVKADIEDRKIFIWVGGPEHTRRAFLAVIRNNFDAIHKTIPGIVADEKVPLPGRAEVVVDYKHLLNLEAMGEASMIPEGLTERVNVKLLLDGLETEEERRERKEGRKMLERVERLPATNLPATSETEDNQAIAELTRIKTQLDLRSERGARWRLRAFVGLLLVMWACLAVLTYKLGWDTMEPWTYFVGGGVTLGTYGYFALTQRELSPTAIYERMIESKKKQNYLASGFDLKRYERLSGED